MPITPFVHVPTNLREWTRFWQECIVDADANASIVDADIPATIARDSEVTAADAVVAANAAAALAAHVAASDPHSTYTTAAELSSAITTAFTNFTSGTYTPTLTSVTNVTASTPRLATYIRVNNAVTVAGQLDIDPTAAGQVQLGISLPVASAMTTAYQLGGVASCVAVLQSTAIYADATNDRAQLEWVTVDVANQSWTYSFTYTVV